MANDIRQIMQNFERQFKPPLQLSEILYPEKEDTKKVYDRIEIATANPGWHRMSTGEDVFISEAEIKAAKGVTPINAGGKRGTFTPQSVPHRYDVKVRQVGLVPEDENNR